MKSSPRVFRSALAIWLIFFDTWLGAGAWQSGTGFRYAELAVPASGKPGFVQLPPATTGILFTNRLAVERYVTNQIYLNGSGVAAGDVDGDGLVDLFFCGLDNHNSLYRNLGNWKFEDVTEQSGVACPNLGATAAALTDLDGDGDLDLIVNSVGGGTHIFFNDGKGHFTAATRGLPLNPGKAGMSLALADIDGDGDLDVYIANYRADTIRDHPQTHLHGNTVNGKPVILSVNGRSVTEPDLIGRFKLSENGKIEEHGEADVLLRNEGGGKFTPVSFTDGTFLLKRGSLLRNSVTTWECLLCFVTSTT